MASGMSDYERLRAENIARNAAVLARLGVVESARAVQQLPREKKPRVYKPAPKKKPVVLRRSLRTQGVSPDIDKDLSSSSKKMKLKAAADNISWQVPVPFSKLSVAGDKPQETSLHTRIVEFAKIEDGYRYDEDQDEEDFDTLTLRLDARDVTRVVPDRILSVMFLPLREKTVILAGDKSGHVGIWNAEHELLSPAVQLYHPHRSPVSSIATVPGYSTKIITASYDGLVLLMDMEQANFSRIHTSSEELSALCYPQEANSLVYLAQGNGELIALDSRSNKAVSFGRIHDQTINTIDFNTQRPDILATGSTDFNVSLWDVRMLEYQNSLATMAHKKAVSSAYFSPSGTQLVSTSYDNKVGFWTMTEDCTEMDEPTLIYHDNQASRRISTFRAIWSLDSKFVYIANKSREIDIISSDSKKIVSRLTSENMTSIPCRLAQHPFLPGCLAGAAAGGKVHLWQPSD